MRKSLLILVALSMAAFSTANSQQLNVAVQGQKALLFNFNGLANLGLSDYGVTGGIGAKYFISNGLAVRGLLQFGINNSTVNTTPQGTDNIFSFGIGAALEYHLPVSASVSPYLGGGLQFMTSSENVNSGIQKTSNTSFGVGALMGVEYFFNQNLSLAAEYQFGLTTTSRTVTNQPDQSNLQVGFQTVGLTMAVYF